MATSNAPQNHGNSAENEAKERCLSAIPTPPRTSSDQRWNASHGITFHSRSQDQTWRPSDSIVFSPGHQTSCRPHSTNASPPPRASGPKTKSTALTPKSQSSPTHGRVTPKPRPYEPPTPRKTLGLELFALGAAAEDPYVAEDDEDLGEVLERATREKPEADRKPEEKAYEAQREVTTSTVSKQDTVLSEPIVAAPRKAPTHVAPLKEASPKQSKELVAAVPRNVQQPKITLNYLSAGEVERLAQLPNPSSMTVSGIGVSTSSVTRGTARSSGLEDLDAYGESIRGAHGAEMRILRELQRDLRMHPAKDVLLLKPSVLEDIEDDRIESHRDMIHTVNELPRFLFKTAELHQIQNRPGTARASVRSQKMRAERLWEPFFTFSQSQARLWDAFLSHDEFCRRRGIPFLRKPLLGIGRRRRDRQSTPTARHRLFECCRYWSEIADYRNMLKKSTDQNLRMEQLIQVQGSWRVVIFKMTNLLLATRQTPGAKARAEQFSRVKRPMVTHWHTHLLPALLDYEHNMRASSSLDPPTAIESSDGFDKHRLSAELSSEVLAAKSLTAEADDDIGQNPKTETFQAPEATIVQARQTTEQATRGAATTRDLWSRATNGLLFQSSNCTSQGESASRASTKPVNGLPLGPSKNTTRDLALLSFQEKQAAVIHDSESLSEHRDKVSFSAGDIWKAILNLEIFVEAQNKRGHETLLSILDFQDMREQWGISTEELRFSMHCYRIAVRDTRTILAMLTRTRPARGLQNVRIREFIRLRKLLMLKTELGCSKREFFWAADQLENFQRRRGLRLYTRPRRMNTKSRGAVSFKYRPQLSLNVLGSNFSEFSELIDMQNARFSFTTLDVLIKDVRSSLIAFGFAIRSWEIHLPARISVAFRQSVAMGRWYNNAKSLQRALFLASSQSSFIMDYEDHEASQASVETIDVHARIDGTERPLSAEAYQVPEQAGTPQEGIEDRRGSANADCTLRAERRITEPKHRTPRIDESSLQTQGENANGGLVPIDRIIGASSLEQPRQISMSPKCKITFREYRCTPVLRQINRATIRQVDPPDLAHTELTAHKYMSFPIPVQYEPSCPRRARLELVLSERSMSKMQRDAETQKARLSHSRPQKLRRLSHGSIQKRDYHCNASTSSASSVEKQLPSLSLGTGTSTDCSPLGFRMPVSEVTSPAGQDAEPKYWDYALYRGPLGDKVKVHYCKSKADTERIARLFFDEEVIGFDIEWVPNVTAKEGIKKNVALIQIASETRIALFHLSRFWGQEDAEDFVAPTFRYIMQSPRITKVGVSIKADCTRLRRFLGIESQGLFELSHLYKLVKYSQGDAACVDKRLVKLATQVEEHLGLPLWKGQDVRAGDWSVELNYQQVQYAASDSYAGFQLYHALEQKRLALDPTPPPPYHAELNLPIRLSSGRSIETDDEQTDVDEDTPIPTDPSIPPSVEELARDFLRLQLKAPKIPQSKPCKPSTSTPKPVTPEYTLAQTWVINWRTTLPEKYKPSASPASLRAYALWHEQTKSVPEAAALLRDPPLQNGTVAAYIVETLRLERLPFGKERLAAVLDHIPSAGRGRYRKFAKGVGLEFDP